MKAKCALIAVLAVGVVASAYGQYDPYVVPMDGPPLMLPPEPEPPPVHGDPWNWPEPWRPLMPGETFDIPAGGSLYLGMDNLFQGHDWWKEVWLEVQFRVDVAGLLPDASASFYGYHPIIGLPNGSAPWELQDWSQVFDGTDWIITAKWWWYIYPQPDWEFVGITNNTGSTFWQLAVVDFGHICIPAPGTLALLGVCGLETVRRRR